MGRRTPVYALEGHVEAACLETPRWREREEEREGERDVGRSLHWHVDAACLEMPRQSRPVRSRRCHAMISVMTSAVGSARRGQSARPGAAASLGGSGMHCSPARLLCSRRFKDDGSAPSPVAETWPPTLRTACTDEDVSLVGKSTQASRAIKKLIGPYNCELMLDTKVIDAVRRHLDSSVVVPNGLTFLTNLLHHHCT